MLPFETEHAVQQTDTYAYCWHFRVLCLNNFQDEFDSHGECFSFQGMHRCRSKVLGSCPKTLKYHLSVLTVYQIIGRKTVSKRNVHFSSLYLKLYLLSVKDFFLHLIYLLLDKMPKEICSLYFSISLPLHHKFFLPLYLLNQVICGLNCLFLPLQTRKDMLSYRHLLVQKIIVKMLWSCANFPWNSASKSR